MAISTDPKDPNFGLEADPKSPDFGLPERPPVYDPQEVYPEGRVDAALHEFQLKYPRVYGGLGTIAGLVPTSLEQAKQMLTLPRVSDVEEQQQASERLGAAWRGEYGPEAQGAAFTGTGLAALPLLHLPFAESPLRATPADLGLVEQIRASQQAAAAPPPSVPDPWAPPAEGAAAPPPPYDPMAPVRWHQAVMAKMQPALAQKYMFEKGGMPVPKIVLDVIKAGNEELQQGYQPPQQLGQIYASSIGSAAPPIRYSGTPSGGIVPEEPGITQTQSPAVARLRSDQGPQGPAGIIPSPEPGAAASTAAGQVPAEVTYPEKPPVYTRKRADALAAAEKQQAVNPNFGQNVVDRALRSNRALDDIEHAHVQLELEKTRSAYEATVDAVNSLPQKSPEQAAAMAALDQSWNRFQNATNAAYKAGTATARGLAFRAGTDQFSMARMLREMQAHNAGRPLTREMVERTREMSGKLESLSKEIPARAELSKRLDALAKEYAQGRVRERMQSTTRAASQSFFSDAAAKARDRIAQRRAEGRLYTGIDPEALYDHAVVGADLLARGITSFGRWSTEMIKQLGKEIRPYLFEIYDRAKQLYQSTLNIDKKLSAYKKRLATRTESLQEEIKTLQARIAKGDFSEPPRAGKLALDKEAIGMQRELNTLRDQWKKELNMARKNAQPGWRKALDTLTEALRAEKLTGVGTLGKIGSAVAQRPLTSLAEDIAGRVSTAIPPIREIARGAPTENPVVGSLARYPGAALEGLKEFPAVLRGEHEPPEYSSRGPGFLQYPGRLHGAMKNVIRSPEYQVGLDRATKWAQKEGLDVTNPEVAAQVQEYANQRGLRAIWMNDNFASRQFRNFLAMMERTGGAPGFIGSRLGRILLPIVRVPTNVAIEAGRYHFGIPNALTRIGVGLVKGIDKMSPAEKDLVMMNLKKGQVGAALFAYGYFDHKNHGGFYNKDTYKDKEKQTGLRPMESRFGGVTLPSWAAHSAPMMMIHAGATFHDMQEHKHGVIGSEIGVLKGMFENIPFMNAVSQVDDLVRGDEYSTKRAAGSFIRGQVSPVILQEMARWTDQHDANGHPIKRYTRDISDEIKMGYPGFREDVPTTKAKRKSAGLSLGHL